MADIFLSYSRVDRPTAQIIAEALESEGFSVWWDKILRAGQTYDEVTETMLRDSHVVVVLWSQTSVKSTWVRAEATQGQRNGVLIPAMIEEAERPIMFELVQTADLIDWSGDRSDERWGNFVADLKRGLEMPKPAGALASAAPSTAPKPDPKPTPPPPPAPKVTAAPPPAEPVPAAVTPPPKKKKSSNPLPMLIGAIVLGAGGWFGYQAWLETRTEEPHCDICPETVNIAGGSFMMGSPDDEPRRTGNEGPRRDVTLAKFAISKTEITQDQWQLCVDAGGCEAARGASEGSGPVTGIN